MKYRFQQLLGIVVIGALMVVAGCSLNTLMARTISGVFAGGDGPNPFLSDDDPALIGEALPFTLKLFDALLLSDPDNPTLWHTTGQSYIAYAGIFLQLEAAMLPEEEFERNTMLNRRAKVLYLRGQRQVMTAIELRHPGFADAVEPEAFAAALASMTVDDVPYLYWAAIGQFGAFSVDPLDIGLGRMIERSIMMIDRAFELDPEYAYGAIDDFYITYYGNLPEGLGGDKERARNHFDEAVRISGGALASPYISLAKAVMIPEQRLDEFVQLMEQALAVDTDLLPDQRLINTVRQREAQWHLDNLELFFIEIE